MLGIFAVYDVKSSTFANPFVSKNKFTAIRDFQNAVCDEQSYIYKYPEDFILYDVGTFDPDTGEITASTPPVHLGTGIQYKI